MDDTDLDFTQDEELDVSTPQESADITGTTGKLKATPKNPDTVGFIQRGQETRQQEADSMGAVLGRFDRKAIQDELRKSSSDITTFEAMTRNFDSAPRQANDGSIVLPQVPDIDTILAKNSAVGRNIYDKNYKANTAKLSLITQRYKNSLTPEGQRRQNWEDYKANWFAEGRDVLYYGGEGIAGISNIIAGAAAAVGLGAGKVQHIVGTLGSEENNMILDNAILMQDVTVQAYAAYDDWVNRQLSGLSSTGERTYLGRNIVANVAPVIATVLTAGATGSAVAGGVLARGAAKGVSKAAATQVAKRGANIASKRIGKAVSATYAADLASDYWMREAEGKTSEEYRDYLRAKTGGEAVGDVVFGTAIGLAGYYLEKMFGAEAAVQNFFGNATKGIIKTFGKRAYQEGLTEVAQDATLDIADLIRGKVFGNEDRGIGWGEFAKRLISTDTLETFVISAAIGGFAGSAEYATARANIGKEYKANLKKVFPNATEEQLETATGAFLNSTEENVVGKIHQSIIADDQLRNKYGTYNTIVQNRINELIDQTIAEGYELEFKDKSPEYQAQLVGSISQRFIDELYAQAWNRQVPVSEVFDVTKMDTKNGILYMYGEEYGRRPLTELTANLTPAQYEQMQVEKRIADELQKQQKEQEKQIKAALQEAKKREREAQRELAKQEKKKETQDKVLARVEIRRLEENQARGILSALRPDLPVQAMKKGEIKTILRSEIDNYVALQNRDQIQPIERQKPARERQKKAVEEEVFNQQLREQSDLAAENERLDAENPEYTGETIKIKIDDSNRISRKPATISDRIWNYSESDFIQQADKTRLWRDKIKLYSEYMIAQLYKAGYYAMPQSSMTTYSEYMLVFTGQPAAGGDIVAKIRISDHGKGIQENDYNFVKVAPKQFVERIKQTINELPKPIFERVVEKTVYNSNGDRIAKSEQALRNFYNWFGDSKVVDDNGRPLVVYHGTSSDFDTFDIDQSGKNTGTAIYGKGFYFTTNKDVATKWGQKRGEPIVMSAYVKLENPNMVEELSYPKDSQEKGFDGVIAKVWGSNDLEIVAFEPNQIKSTDNRGTFSPDTGNIYHQKQVAAWNPLRRSIQLFSGANETSIAHELSHFWLDNMMIYSRLNAAANNQGFQAVWKNIKNYLNIDDRQERINESQAEKYTSAYMQYIRGNKIAPAMDLGFKGYDEYIEDISLDYFENALHSEEDGTISSELELITPEMMDAFQKLTSADLSQLRDRLIDIQMSEESPETVTDAKLGEEATPEQMRKEQDKEIRAQQEKQTEQNTAAAIRESQPVEPQTPSKEMSAAYDSLAKQPVTSSNYEIGTADVEAFAKAREIIAKDRAAAEAAVAENPSGITDGIPNAFIALELGQQAVQNGKNAMPYLESFADGASAAGASLRTANLLNQPEFAWAKDIYEAAKAKEYGLALRMRPQAKNALMHRSAILRSMESRLDEYVEKLYPQLMAADSYEAQVKLINDWGNKTAKDLGLIPGTETWGQSIKGVSTKKTDFGKQITYQKKKLKEFLKSKLRASLTDAEQLKVRELHRNAMDSLRALRTNPTDWNTKVEFIKQTRAYQDYLNSLQPANWATATFASIPRASMLFRISTQVKNTLGTRVEVLLSDLNRQLRYGKDNLISSKEMKKQIKESMDMFLIGGFSPDVQESFFESPTLAWGEKQFSLAARGGERRGVVFSKERLAQDAKDIADYAKNTWQTNPNSKTPENLQKAWAATKIGIATFERVAGKSYDTMAYCDAYMKALSAVHESAKAATFYAQQEGKVKGWSKEQIKKRAEELFADARSYIPKTKIGEAIRKQATEQAKLETFIKSGTLAQIANNIRKGLNLGKESGIGTVIAPFVSTPANIMQMGVDYSFGWWRRFDGWADVKKRIKENAKAGKPIDQKDMEFLEKGYRGIYGGLFLLTILALFKGAQALSGDDDYLDYVPPYDQLTTKERQYYKAVNGGKYNAIKFDDTWINVEYFGGMSEAIAALGTWYHNNSLISAGASVIMRSPVIGDLISQRDDLQRDMQYDKGIIDIAMESVQAQSKKYIPGIAQDLWKAREKGVLYPFLGGSFGFTQGTTFGLGESDIKEVKDAQIESGASYMPVARGKAFSDIDYDVKRQINKEFDELYNAEASKWVKSHKNAKPEETKKALNAIRKNLTKKIKQKYKIK